MTDTLRSCIIAEPGYTFLSLDASQIELRVLAILSQDPQMLADLATGDLHLATAIRMSELRGIPVDSWINDPDTKKSKRYEAKQGNFATVYGADEYKLAQMFDCTEEKAAQFMAGHKAAYPRMYEWMGERKELAKSQGYVVNIFGRKRAIPNLNSSVWKLREEAEREVVNTEVQGTAVDIVKMAMLYLRGLFDVSVRLVLQVHDEILWEVPDTLLPQTLEQCQELVGAFPSYPFSIKIGKIYGEMEEHG